MEKGYLSQALCEELTEEGITLVTNVRKNMKANALSLWNKLMLRKHFVIETVSVEKYFSDRTLKTLYSTGSHVRINCLHFSAEKTELKFM
ncbi:transposase [Photorhabdus sp. APURE]|nr:transposase [Photorhabdus aballayi]MCW7546926.1 transposase [Photorhabdus aballayi]